MHLYLIHKQTVHEQSKIPSTIITEDHTGSTRSNHPWPYFRSMARRHTVLHACVLNCCRIRLAECPATNLVRKELPSLARQAHAHACHMLICSSAAARAMWGSMSVTSEAIPKTQSPNIDDSHAMSPQADLASSVEKAISPGAIPVSV